MSPLRADPGDVPFAVLRYMVLLFILSTVILPFVYILSVSLRPPTELFGEPHWVPRTFTLSGWRAAWDAIGDQLLTSFYVAAGTSALSLLITVPGAYVFARKEFPGRKLGFYAVLVALFFPYVLLIIPLTRTWFELGIHDTIPGLWLAYQVFITPFAIWILRDFFEQLPTHLEEAAQVYGCTEFTAFLRVIVPISMPAIVSVGFLAFLVGWNDFLFASLLTGQNARTAVVELFLITTGAEGQNWPRLMAMTLIIGIPPSVLYMISRRYLAEAFAVTE